LQEGIIDTTLKFADNISTIFIMKKQLKAYQYLIIFLSAIFLALLTFVFVDPFWQYKVANDVQRSSQVNEISVALGKYLRQSKQSVPLLNKTPHFIGSGDNQIDLCRRLLPTFLPKLPSDPSLGNPRNNVTYPCPSKYFTGYEVYLGKNNQVVVFAHSEEENKNIISTQ